MWGVDIGRPKTAQILIALIVCKDDNDIGRGIV
jgi:hypothetical protein